MREKRKNPEFRESERLKKRAYDADLREDEERLRRRRKTARIWRANNPEKVKAQQQRNYQKTRDRHKARSAARRKKSAKKLQIYFQKYHQLNAEKRNAENRQRRAMEMALNPEKVRLKAREKNHRKRANGGKLSKDLIKLLMSEQDGKYVYCFGKLTEIGFNLDHVMPLSRGGRHEDSNVQLTCPKCNGRKSAKHPLEFLKKAGVVAKVLAGEGF